MQVLESKTLFKNKILIFFCSGEWCSFNNVPEEDENIILRDLFFSSFLSLFFVSHHYSAAQFEEMRLSTVLLGSLKNSKTHANLKEAFAGESQANRRYLWMAQKVCVFVRLCCAVRVSVCRRHTESHCCFLHFLIFSLFFFVLFSLFFCKADVEGHSEVAAVFRSAAEGETGHAFGHLEFMEAIGDPATGEPIGPTEDNLKSAIAGGD